MALNFLPLLICFHRQFIPLFLTDDFIFVSSCGFFSLRAVSMVFVSKVSKKNELTLIILLCDTFIYLSIIKTTMDKKFSIQFLKDMNSILRIGDELDKHYEKPQEDLASYEKKFEKLLQSFSKKYKLCSFKLVKRTDHLETQFFLYASSLKEVFDTASSKIPGFHSVGKDSVHTTSASDVAAASQLAEKTKDTLYLAFADAEHGKSTIFLKAAGKKIQVIYNADSFSSENTAEFKVAALYASQEHDESIKIDQEAATFGFSDWLNNAEKRKYHDRYSVHMGE